MIARASINIRTSSPQLQQRSAFIVDQSAQFHRILLYYRQTDYPGKLIMTTMLSLSMLSYIARGGTIQVHTSRSNWLRSWASHCHRLIVVMVEAGLRKIIVRDPTPLPRSTLFWLTLPRVSYLGPHYIHPSTYTSPLPH